MAVNAGVETETAASDSADSAVARGDNDDTATAIETQSQAANDAPLADESSSQPWLVCHCKPRCEKKFADLMRAQHFEHYLPLIVSEKRYGTRIKRFTKPLFPGYVFAQVPSEKKVLIYQQDLLARAIEVEDTARLLAQLADIKTLIASGLDFRLTPQLAKGYRVRIVSGPLKGVEGRVEDPNNPRGGVLLSVDVLQQGLLVPIPAVDLKVLP